MLINWPQNNQGLQPLEVFLVNQEWSAHAGAKFKKVDSDKTTTYLVIVYSASNLNLP